MSPAVPLPVVLPLLIAALLFLTEHVQKSRWLMDLLTISTTGAVLALDLEILFATRRETVVYWFGGWKLVNGFPVGITFTIDPLGAGLACLTAVLTFWAMVYTWHYFESIGPYFHSLMLLFLAALTGFSLTGDLFNLFVFFELMGVAAYSLTGYQIEDTGPLEGALNFSVMNSIGAMLVLAGIALVYARTGALNMAQAGKALDLSRPDILVFVSFGLLLAGFAVKASMAPFHFWLPDAHAVAPTPVSVLFSGVMVEMGLYAIARVYWTMYAGVFSGHAGGIRAMLLAGGGVSCLLGAVMCFAQRHLKRMLAFSTVSHAGLMMSGLALLNVRGLAGASFYLAGHGLVKGALFICAGVVLHKFGSVDEAGLHGRAREMRPFGALFLIGGLALAGLPPFGTFTGKAMVEEAATDLGYGWLTPVAVLASALTGGAVIRAAAGIFFGWGKPSAVFVSAPSWGSKEPPESRERRWTPLVLWGPAAVMLLLSLASGVAPGLPAQAISGASRFADTQAYRAAVLEGKPQARTVLQGFRPKPSSFAAAFASVVLAVLLAAWGLASHKLPNRFREESWRLLAPPLLALRRIHSGFVEDYVVWLMAGSAVITGLLALMAR